MYLLSFDSQNLKDMLKSSRNCKALKDICNYRTGINDYISICLIIIDNFCVGHFFLLSTTDVIVTTSSETLDSPTKH